jgi:hypothetical protein
MRSRDQPRLAVGDMSVDGTPTPSLNLIDITAPKPPQPALKRCCFSRSQSTTFADGGQATGLRTVWIDRGTWPGHEHDADRIVTDVPQAER